MKYGIKIILSLFVIVFLSLIGILSGSYKSLSTQLVDKFDKRLFEVSTELTNILRKDIIVSNYVIAFDYIDKVAEIRKIKYFAIVDNETQNTDLSRRYEKYRPPRKDWKKHKEHFLIKESSLGMKYIKKSVYFDEEKKEKKADIIFGHSLEELEKELIELRFIFISISAAIVLVLIFSFYIGVILYNKFNSKILSYFESVAQGKKIESTDEFIEFRSLFHAAEKMSHMIGENQKIMASQASLKAKSDMAFKLSHDIRSPLVSLSVAIKNCKDIPEEERILIRTQIGRITDIANDLLLKNRQNHGEKKSSIETILMSTVLEEIVTEKRLEYRSNLDIKIECDVSESYGLFAKVNGAELKTIISNTINNSVESFSEGKGQISVKLGDSTDNVKIKIRDNGQGMSQEVLEKLGRPGFTHGKEKHEKSGTGLGVAYAMKQIRDEWNGEMSYQSAKGSGTIMTITLPKQTPPSWFLSRIKIKEKMAVICLDDDEGIHCIWKKRIRGEVTLFHLSTPEQLKEWVKKESSKYQDILYLSDYELIGFEQSGLDLIESLELKNAVLVTSRFGRPEIRSRCSKLGVKLIPKIAAGSVPIKFEKKVKTHKGQGRTKYDTVHIDDNKYIRSLWQEEAEKEGLSLLSCSNERQLFHKIEQVEGEAHFYIDVNLGEDHIPGDKLAQKLFDLGYKNLYLSTGYEAEKFKGIAHLIKGLVDKYPSFL